MKKILGLLVIGCLTAFCGSSSSDDDETNTNPTNPTNPTSPTNPVADNPTEASVSQYDGYTLVWNDEFNTATLDATKWSYETGTGVNGDFGTGQLDRATDRTDNVSLVDGTGTDKSLAITTRKEDYADRHYTSGRINTKDKFSCGPGYRIEARIWARDVKYKGQGFAFWMMPQEKPDNQDYIMWPQGGEVDITEYIGTIPFENLGSVHYAWNWLNNEYHDGNHAHKGGYYSYQNAQAGFVDPNVEIWPTTDNNPKAGSGAYHLYRVDWYDDRIEFSIDGNVYHINYFSDGAAFSNAPDGQDADGIVTSNGKNLYVSEYSHHFPEWQPFSHKFYMILSAGVGGNDNLSYGGAVVPQAKFPCSTLIDYVRVYKRN